jgi:hypothetical protein
MYYNDLSGDDEDYDDDDFEFYEGNNQNKNLEFESNKFKKINSFFNKILFTK